MTDLEAAAREVLDQTGTEDLIRNFVAVLGERGFHVILMTGHEHPGMVGNGGVDLKVRSTVPAELARNWFAVASSMTGED